MRDLKKTIPTRQQFPSSQVRSSMLATILAGTVGGLVGCDHAVPPSALLASSSSASVQPDSEQLRQIHDSVHAYVTAIANGNSQVVNTLISPELRERIASRGHELPGVSKFEVFIERERGKLLRVLSDVGVDSDFTATTDLQVQHVELLARDTVAVARMSVRGQLLPKPLYLVRHQDRYLVNVVMPAAGQEFSVTSYRVENDDYANRLFSCSGYGPYSIGPHPTQRYISCQDSCRSWWFFDGTTFETPGATADCDYNTWGTDMYIRNGYPICADPC